MDFKCDKTCSLRYQLKKSKRNYDRYQVEVKWNTMFQNLVKKDGSFQTWLRFKTKKFQLLYVGLRIQYKVRFLRPKKFDFSTVYIYSFLLSSVFRSLYLFQWEKLYVMKIEKSNSEILDILNFEKSKFAKSKLEKLNFGDSN